MVFKTRQECEGADWRVAVKRNETISNRSPYLGPRGSLFKKRPFGPVLKDKQQKPKTPGAPAAGYRPVSFRPRLVTSILRCKDQYLADLLQRHIISRGLCWKMLPHIGEFRPLRRATRRCPPWTRTGLMSGDRKATRYWALGFGHGSAPAETSPAPVRQRQGNRLALYSFRLQAPTRPPHTVKPRSGG